MAWVHTEEKKSLEYSEEQKGLPLGANKLRDWLRYFI